MYKSNQNGAGPSLPIGQNRSNQPGKFDFQQKFTNLNSLMKNLDQDKKDQALQRPQSSQIPSSHGIQKTDETRSENSNTQDANKILHEQVSFMKNFLEQNQKLNQQQVQADELFQNILQATVQSGEETKKVGIISEQITNLKLQIQSSGDLQKERLAQQKQAFEQQIGQLQQQIQEKDQQIQDQAKDFEGYNLQEIQTTMEKLQNENQMRDQIIKELQDKLEEGPQVSSQNNINKKQNGHDNQDLVNKANQQLSNKEEEIKKLEELIENFKTLYQHMNDEKQILGEENEQLTNENQQFREIFSVIFYKYLFNQQNLHLFGIDPNQLNEEQDDQPMNDQEDVEMVDDEQ